MVFIGKISFSLYLWHWPVIVFVQVGLLREQSWPMRAAEMGASLLLAYLSWRFVEQPFRLGAVRFTTKRILGGAALAMALMLCVAGAAVLGQGLPGRYTEHQLALASYENYDGDTQYRGGSCFVVGNYQSFDAGRCLNRQPGQPTLLLLGDSHAAHLWPGLHAQGRSINVLQATHTGCRPLLTADGIKPSACQQFLRTMLTDWLPQHPVDVVVLAGRWVDADLAQLPVTIAAARRYAKQVVVVGPIPQYASALPRFLVRDDGHALERGLVREPFELDPAMHQRASAAGAEYFSLTDALCPQRHCRTLAAPDVPLQFDYGHLTRDGSIAVANLLMPAMQLAPTEPANFHVRADAAPAVN